MFIFQPGFLADTSRILCHLIFIHVLLCIQAVNSVVARHLWERLVSDQEGAGVRGRGGGGGGGAGGFSGGGAGEGSKKSSVEARRVCCILPLYLRAALQASTDVYNGAI